MSKLLAATLAGALVLSACAPANRMSASRYNSPVPTADLAGGPALVTSAHFDDGYRMYQEGQFRPAKRAFARALEDNPGDYTAAYMMGMSYLKRGRYYDARDGFRKSVERAPDRITLAQVYAGMAYSFEAVGHTRMAHHHYHLACASNKSCCGRYLHQR